MVSLFLTTQLIFPLYVIYAASLGFIYVRALFGQWPFLIPSLSTLIHTTLDTHKLNPILLARTQTLVRCIRLLALHGQCYWWTYFTYFTFHTHTNNITIRFLSSGNQVNCSWIFSVFIVQVSQTLMSLNARLFANPSKPLALGYIYDDT